MLRGELLELSLGQSDNNASKLLFKFCGKPKAVEKYMRKLGFHDIHIRMTEEQIVCSSGFIIIKMTTDI